MTVEALCGLRAILFGAVESTAEGQVPSDALVGSMGIVEMEDKRGMLFDFAQPLDRKAAHPVYTGKAIVVAWNGKFIVIA